MSAGCTDSMTASAKCACTITPTSTCRCSHGCLIAAVAATKLLATRFSFPAALCRAGPRTCRFLSIPMWKSQYAASVRRLVRDGVDSPLANLFVHVAVDSTAEAEGADRARSATEAFLYRRLETMPATAGRFHLNAELPIPFDGWGSMEVDLLCARTRSPLNWTAANILATRTPTGAIVARMLCFRRTAIWSCGSLPKTLASISIRFWTRSCGLYHIKTPEFNIVVGSPESAPTGMPRHCSARKYCRRGSCGPLPTSITKPRLTRSDSRVRVARGDREIILAISAVDRPRPSSRRRRIMWSASSMRAGPVRTG